MALFPAYAVDYEVRSPDSKAVLHLTCANGRIQYSVDWNGRKILRPSAVSLFNDMACEVAGVESNAVDKVWKPVWGQWSEIRDHYSEIKLDIKVAGGLDIHLVGRAYNDGVGLRYVVPPQNVPEQPEISFLCEYKLDSDATLFYALNEQEPAGPVLLSDLKSKNTLLGVPVVIAAGSDAFMGLLESDLYSAAPFEGMRVNSSADDKRLLFSRVKADGYKLPLQTSWRVILLGKNAGDLLMSTAALNMAADCRIEDTYWIRSGKAVWDWRVHGYEAADGFKYGVNTASYKRLIEFAAKNNIQYLLIDDNWYTAVSKGRMVVDPALDIAEVIRFGKEKEVGVILYYDRKKGSFGDDVLFSDYAAKGAAGLKYGFMGNKAGFTREAINAAAAQKLLIDFHDGPCPMTGVERTMPNLITREYCHAQQDARKAFTPRSFLKMAMVNALTGPMDQANGCYGLNGINKGERERGPKKRGGFHSTVVSETARVLVVYSGLICLPDAPEEYSKKTDLFEFIKRMPPATWDETRVINARIGERITTARRSGKVWFVGSVIDEKGGELSIPLDFLTGDISYNVTFYEDVLQGKDAGNQEAYNVRQGTLKKGDVVKARLAACGGHCMWIRPAE